MPKPEPANVVPLHPRRRTTDTNPTPATDPATVFLTPEELATMLRLPSVETVYQWRRKHTGPPGFRVGRHLRYSLATVLRWTQDQAAADSA